MTTVHAKNTVIMLGAVDLSQYCTNSEFSQSAETYDKTTYGKNSRVYDGGLLDATFKLEGLYDNTLVSSPRDVIQPLLGTTVTLTRRPEGTGAGLPEDLVDIVITSYVESSPVGDIVKWTMDAQCSDDVASSAQAS